MRSIFLALLLVSSAFSSTTTEEIGLIASSPDQLSSLNDDSALLIGGSVHPLSGQLSLSHTDLVAKGAQEVSLFRVFIPVTFNPPIPVHSEMQAYYDERTFLASLQKSHRGWVFMPHLKLERKQAEIKVPDKNGAIYSFINGKLIHTSGICNTMGDTPSGCFDPRNIHIIDEKESITVALPEGTKRKYVHHSKNIYNLSKEILPNGKILKYSYLENKILIQSYDPQEKHLYAFILIDTAAYKNEFRIRDKLKKGSCGTYKHEGTKEISYTLLGLPYTAVQRAKTNTGQTASYGYEPTSRSRLLKKKCGNFNYEFSFAPNLINASTPYDRQETFSYENFLPKSHSDRSCPVRVDYNGSPSRINTVYLPRGENDALIPLYTLDFQNGTPTATDRDGYKTIYSFSSQMLPTSIQWIAPSGKVVKVKTVSWDGSNQLSSIEWKDGENHLFWKRSFEDYDPFHNAQKEKFSGDLTGSDDFDTYTVTRLFSQDGRNLLLREETADGLVTTFEYVEGTHLLKNKITQGKSVHIRETFEYDEYKNLKMKTIEEGDSLGQKRQRRVTVYTLKQKDPFLHMPEWIEESYGLDSRLIPIKKTKLTYDPYGNICQEDVYGSDGLFAYSVKRTFDEQGNILSETNPLGNTATCSYNLKGLPDVAENFSKRLKTQKAYNAAGQVKKITETGKGLTHTTLYEYNLMGQLEKEIDPFDNAIHYKRYDTLANQPTLIEFPPIASMDRKDPVPVVKTAKYDGLGRLIEKVDANHQITKYKYNAYGSPIEITFPNGSFEKFRYYKNGELHLHTAPGGLVTEYSYDVLKRVIEKKYSFAGKHLTSETFTYDSFHLKSHKDKEGITTTYEWDGAGRKISETRAGRTVLFTYDSLGRLATEVCSGICFQTDYDTMGQLTEKRKTDLMGNVLHKISYTYNADGNRETTTRYPHHLAAKTTFSYDPFQRITSITDPTGKTSSTTYDETKINHLKQRVLTKTLTDANGISTVIISDPYGREVSRKISGLRIEERFYDPAGNLTHIKEGPRLIRYTYNPMNLPETLTRAFGSVEQRTTTYTYTPAGLLKTKQLPTGLSINFTYDPFNYPETVISSDGSLSQRFTYTRNGALLYSSDRMHTVKRELDPFGNTLTETIDGKWTISKSYDFLDRPLTLTLPDQTMIRYTYDPLYVKTVERLSATGALLYKHTYESYDQNGDLLLETLPFNLGARSYGYDPNARLKDLSSPYFSQTLTYDPGGRIKHISSEGSFTYDDLDELTAEPSHAYSYDSRYNRTGKDGVPFKHNHLDEIATTAYDLNGNLTQKGSFVLSYDPLNRLIGAKSQTELLRFSYDPLGRRLTKSQSEDMELYLYDDMQEIASLHPSGALKDLCIRGQDGKPVALELQGQTFIPICDFRGNVRRIIDPNTQMLVQSLNYTAFGEETTRIEKPFNPWRYSAKRFDRELGLSYFGHRYYDASLGRWMTADPLGFVDGLNLYTYVFNDPLSYGDADGRFAIPLLGLSWGASGCAATAIFSNPVGWVIGCAVITTVAVGWATQQLIESRHIPPSTGSTINTIIGGLAGSMINSGLSMSCGDFYTGDLNPSICGQSLGQLLYGNTYNSMFKSKDGERRSSDKPGSPPIRGDKLPNNRAESPGAEFGWKGKGPPESGRGRWIRGEGKSRESLHPDLEHPAHGPHWDYEGPGFPKGARLYPDGTWEPK